MGLRAKSIVTTSFEAEELAHVAVVLRLAVFGAQVEPQLVDHLDAVIAKPVLPAVRTNRLVDALADLVIHRRLGQLVSPRPVDATGPLALEAAWGPGRRRRLPGGDRLPELDQHPFHLVARH